MSGPDDQAVGAPEKPVGMYSATKVFEPRPEDLRTFDPRSESLARIGAWWFRGISGCVLAIECARSGALDPVSDELWISMHARLRTAIHFAERCTRGLGARLDATGLVPDAFGVEKRARDLVQALLEYDVCLSGSPITAKRDGQLVPPGMIRSAQELKLVGDLFCNVPTAATRRPPELARKPLSDTARTVYEILCSLPEIEGRTAKMLVRELADRGVAVSGEEYLRDEVRRELLPYGLENGRGQRGYFIPMNARPPASS